MAKQDHETYMRQALDLAARARGRTSPNPMVGAVVVKGGKVIGRGYHKKAGTAHAEVAALAQAGAAARGATLYVTLEPCAHHGRTPACAPRVAAAGVARVVTAMQDPNPLVAGRGAAILEQAGIEVIRNVLEPEALALNESYVKFITTGKPFIILKAGMTLDGKIATDRGQSQWITGPEARRDAQEIRRDCDAVLVGANTLLMDDPSLTCRLPGKPPQPLRVVLDGNLRVRPGLKFVKNAGDGLSLIVTREDADAAKMRRLEKAGCRILQAPADKRGRIAIPALARALGGLGVTSVLVEGGGAIHDAFLRAGEVDKVVFYVAPKILGGAQSHTAVDGLGFANLDRSFKLKFTACAMLGGDLKIQAYPQK